MFSTLITCRQSHFATREHSIYILYSFKTLEWNLKCSSRHRSCDTLTRVTRLYLFSFKSQTYTMKLHILTTRVCMYMYTIRGFCIIRDTQLRVVYYALRIEVHDFPNVFGYVYIRVVNPPNTATHQPRRRDNGLILWFQRFSNKFFSLFFF